MRIALIGGGIAGLAAAYELEKSGAAGAPVDYTLFEQRPQLGGSLASEIVNGAVLNAAPIPSSRRNLRQRNFAASLASAPS